MENQNQESLPEWPDDVPVMRDDAPRWQHNLTNWLRENPPPYTLYVGEVKPGIKVARAIDLVAYDWTVGRHKIQSGRGRTRETLTLTVTGQEEDARRREQRKQERVERAADPTLAIARAMDSLVKQNAAQAKQLQDSAALMLKYTAHAVRYNGQLTATVERLMDENAQLRAQTENLMPPEMKIDALKLVLPVVQKVAVRSSLAGLIGEIGDIDAEGKGEKTAEKVVKAATPWARALAHAVGPSLKAGIKSLWREMSED